MSRSKGEVGKRYETRLYAFRLIRRTLPSLRQAVAGTTRKGCWRLGLRALTLFPDS